MSLTDFPIFSPSLISFLKIEPACKLTIGVGILLVIDGVSSPSEKRGQMISIIKILKNGKICVVMMCDIRIKITKYINAVRKASGYTY